MKHSHEVEIFQLLISITGNTCLLFHVKMAPVKKVSCNAVILSEMVIIALKSQTVATLLSSKI